MHGVEAAEKDQNLGTSDRWAACAADATGCYLLPRDALICGALRRCFEENETEEGRRGR